MNKSLMIGLVAVIAVVAILIATQIGRTRNQATSTPTAQTTVIASISSEPTSTPLVTSIPTASSVATHDITFTGQTFTPRSLTIKKGDTVRFLNNGSRSIWVASDPHPIHTKYRDFDANRGYTPSEIYSFTFTQAGTWSYHDHLNSSQTGTVTVE